MADASALVQRLDALEKNQAMLLASLEQAETDRDAYKKLYYDMIERCHKLERGLLGQRAERLPKDDKQLSLSMMEMMLSERQVAEVDALSTKVVSAHTRRKPTGRKPIPDNLPRVEIEVVPEEVKRAGLDAFERIGQEVTEVLERRPASLVVAQIIKGKYKRIDRTDEQPAIYVGKTPTLPIERGLAGPGMLADTIVKRWQDHLPLHRLEGIYDRDGLALARSTICEWHQRLCELAEPVIAAMRQDAFAQPYLCTDATGVLVQAKDKCRTGHFWVCVAPKKHVLFEFTRDHTKSAVDDVLCGYEGYLVADAHVVYDHLYHRGDVVEVNCWAHARRYFFKALSSDPERAKVALGLIDMLFRIERSVATAPKKKRLRLRKKHAAPVIARLYAWANEQWPKTLEATPLYDGIRYIRNQKSGLLRFLEDGRLPLDNNISERELRRQAVGRKNWLFVGSDDGAQANATFTSLLASCRMLNVEPWAYLRDLLCLLPSWPAHRALELAPAYWDQTAKAEETRQLLDENPYRKLTLDHG